MSERLESWKEIAQHLRSSVRTVQRWEKTEGLPVRRHQHGSGATVYALASELDAWREARGPGAVTAAPTPPVAEPVAERAEASVADWQGRVDALVARLAQRVAEPPHAACRAVGREHEVAELVAGVEAGDERLFCLAGEPGIGKSALLDDFCAELRARASRPVIVRGACSERLAGSEAYLAILDALEHLLDGPGAEALRELLRLVAPTWFVQVAPLWLRADPGFDVVREEALGASGERLKRELAAFFRSLSEVGPVVIVLDDMHWADASTVELVGYLVRRSELERVRLVVAHRRTELLVSDHPFLSMKRALQERRLCRELPLSFLTAEHVGLHLERAYPGNAFPEEFATALHARTEGNPLFMVGLLGELERSGRIVREGHGWAFEGDVAALDTGLPESIRGLIEHKLSQLEPLDHELLAIASVQGAVFDSAIVARVQGEAADRIERRLQALEHVNGLIRRIDVRDLPDGSLSERYAFVHILYQNDLHEALTPNQRVRLSLDVGEALGALFAGQTRTVALELALLFHAGRDFARAADHFLLASKHAAELSANAEAAALGRRAIESAERLSGAERSRRMLAAAFQVADLNLTLSHFPVATEAYELAARSARELGDQESLVLALFGVATSQFFHRELRESRRVGEEALAFAQGIGFELGIAQAQSILAMNEMCKGDLDAALVLFDKALPTLKAELDRGRALVTVSFSGLVHVWRLDWERADEVARWWMRGGKLANLPVAQLHFVMGMAEGNRGLIGRALKTLRSGRAIAELNEDLYYFCRLPNTEGWLHREFGSVETAIPLDLESVTLGREFGFEEAEANAQVNLAEDHFELGDPERALEHLRLAERLFEEDVWFRWRYSMRLQAGFARYHIAKGDLDRAKQHVAESLEVADRVMARKHIARGRMLQGDIALLEGRLDDGRAAYAGALEVIERFQCPSLEWRILSAAANAAELARDDVAADRYRGRGARVIDGLLESLAGDPLRETFLALAAVRALRNSSPRG